jgi:hypothetical protein
MTKKSTYVVAVFVGFVAATISYFQPYFPYFIDSASYIEQARSFLARGVFEATPYRFELIPYKTDNFIIPYRTIESNTVFVPDRLFPAGYPFLIAISSLFFQTSAEKIAPFLSLAALLLLPTIIVFSFQRIIGLWNSLWIGILVALTPVAIRSGYIAYSDTLSLLLVIFAVNRLLVAENKASSWFYLGLLTGFSYLIRNGNLALLISIGVFLCWYMVIESENRKQIIKNTLYWLLGNALFIVPWLIRNLLVFGKFQPYYMRPSTVGLGENSHDFVNAQLDTLLASSTLDSLIINSLSGILLLVIIMAILLHQIITSWHKWQKIEQKTFLISVTYATIGAAITIVARTKYQWGGHIDARYGLAYSCFIFVALAIIFKNSSAKINPHHLFSALAVTLLLVRIFELPKNYQYDWYYQSIIKVANHIESNQDSICSNLNGRFAVSNYAFVYRIMCAAPVLDAYPNYKQNEFINASEESLKSWAVLGSKTGIIVSLFRYNISDNENYFPLNQDELNKLNSLGWQVERNEKENLIISHQAQRINNH